MTNKQLATIFAQFLYNISLSDLNKIIKANAAMIHAQMSLPLSEQRQADKLLKEIIEQALSNGSSEDISRLSGVIIQAVNHRERDKTWMPYENR